MECGAIDRIGWILVLSKIERSGHLESVENLVKDFSEEERADFASGLAES